ncbi:MAG: carboxypeptidase-like regulatory domain-containing protein [Prolixibacteraceae bacterium]|nr:carboxypeptidase-like regulatory domain-containing protein [Prolixibacteraceae bacterium]
MKRQTLFIIALLLSSFAFSGDYIAFNGIVRDAQTGNVIEGVDIFVKNIETGTITNYSGEFFLFITPGKHEVVVNMKGYNTDDTTLDLDADVFYEIILTPKIHGNKPAQWILKNFEPNEPESPENPDLASTI